MTTSTLWEFQFELMTDDGFKIAECIDFRCDVSGRYVSADRSTGQAAGFEDVEANNVEVKVWKFPSQKAQRAAERWIPLPDDLTPYFQRWFRDEGQQYASDELHEAHQDAREAAE